MHTLTGDHDTDLFLTATDMTPGQWETLMSCHHQGSCDSDVSDARSLFTIEDHQSAMDYLIGCGIESDRFIDEDGDIDADAVEEYYLWILAGDIQELGTL